MPTPKVSKYLNSETYFLTIVVRNSYYVFDRYGRWDILANSIKHFQKNKGLLLHDHVFMINHIHFIITSPDVSGFLRDFKKFTSKRIQENIKQYEPQILKLFINNKDKYQFWSRTNMPIIIETNPFYIQKAEYIENNPVVKDYVTSPEYWIWSSANPLSELVLVELEI